MIIDTTGGRQVKMRVVNLEGHIVRARVKMHNSLVEIPEGARMKVTNATPRWGLDLKTEPCEHCGVAVRISKVRPYCWRQTEVVMRKSEIVFCGNDVLLVCDEKCNKAWGISSREKFWFSEDEDDDYEFLADPELGDAPEDPGSYEGGEGKPVDLNDRHNKWCARECERSALIDLPMPSDLSPEDYLWDWDLRQANLFSRRDDLLRQLGRKRKAPW